MRDGKRDWFLLNAPKRSHKGLAVSTAITCQHVCSLLSKKNLFLTFDDTNGIGTAQNLLEQVLQNTGWTLKYCETFYETDGVTEKIRSLKSENKRGAYLLISDMPSNNWFAPSSKSPVPSSSCPAPSTSAWDPS